MNLRPQRKNANKHSEHGLRLLEKSLQQDGWIDAQTIAADGEMISGSARLEVAGEKFADVEPIIVESDGTRPVIVKRTDIPNADDPRARRLSVAANQIAHTDWNPDGELLKEWGNEDKDIRAMFADSEWEEVTGEERPSKDAEPQIDRAAELLEKWQVKTGDLWQIGEHRLICGDCTDVTVVARVMGGEKADMTFIDPPYNALKSWNKDEAHSETRLDPTGWFANDNLEWNEYWLFVENLFKALQGHSVYVCCDYRIYAGIRERIEKAGYQIKHCIVWKKNVWGLGKRYRFQHEFIVYACKKNAPFYGGHDQSDVWELDIHKTTEHKTPKPVELPERAIRNSSQDNGIVFDGCSGFGTVMVACQNLGRRGRAVEISPAYCAVTLERMATAFPGIKIKRLE